MKLNDFATKLIAESNSLKAAFGGMAGSGKSYNSMQFIIESYKEFKLKKPLLIIDNEKSSKFLKPFFDDAKIEVYINQSDTLRDVQQGFEFLRKGEIDFLFIDSLTNVYKRFVEDYKKSEKVTFMSLLHWGRVIPLWDRDFTKPFIELNGNICFTGRGGYEWTKDADELNNNGEVIKKGEMYKDNVKLKLPGEAAFEPDFIGWCASHATPNGKGLEVYHTVHVIKDRSTRLDGKLLVNPKPVDFKPYIDFMQKLKIGDVHGTIRSNNELIPAGADREYYKRLEQKQISIEKIKSYFDKFGLSGTSKDAKQINTLIAEKVFGTTSWKEIENASLEAVENHLRTISIFFGSMDESILADKDLMINYIKNYELKQAA